MAAQLNSIALGRPIARFAYVYVYSQARERIDLMTVPGVEWEAFGKNGKKAGDSKISLILDSCTILEEWTSANVQQGLRYSGKSFNMYNAANKTWQQYWIDNTGGVTNYNSGKYLNGKLVYQTENVKVNDTTWLMQRLTFYNLGKDKVRQHGENSGDGGKTWVTSYDLEYRRKN